MKIQEEKQGEPIKTVSFEKYKYTVDWDKVETIKDLTLLLKAAQLNINFFESTVEKNHIQHLVKEL